VAHSRNPGIPLEGFRHRREFLFRPPIVSIEEGNDAAVQLRQSCVIRRHLAAIREPYVANRWKKFLDKGRSAVRRAVIHHNDFHFSAREILLQHAHDRLLDVLLGLADAVALAQSLDLNDGLAHQLTM
jgi:hypothetical protein